MPATPPVTLSRRALLHVGSVVALGTLAPLYTGCGGSGTELPDSEAFPEVYREVYRLETEAGEENYYSTVTAATDDGHIFVSQSSYLSDAGRSFRLVRYSDHAQPGVTARREIMPPKVIPEGERGILAVSAAGKIYLSRFYLDGSYADDAGSELAVLDSDGTPRGAVTLSNPVGVPGVSYDYLTGANFSVSPDGDFYGTARLQSPEGVLLYDTAAVFRWDASGRFVEAYGEEGKRRWFGSRVAFSPEGIPFALGSNEGENGMYYRPLREGSQADDVPIRAGKFSTGGYQLQTDDAGNFYALGTEDPSRHATSRTAPEPREVFVRKFSPAGRELAFVRVNGNEHITSLAVGGDGDIYVMTGATLRVFRRTR